MKRYVVEIATGVVVDERMLLRLLDSGRVCVVRCVEPGASLGEAVDLTTLVAAEPDRAETPEPAARPEPVPEPARRKRRTKAEMAAARGAAETPDETPETEPEPAPESASEPEPVADETPEPDPREALKAALNVLVRQDFNKAVEVLAEFGARKLSEVPADKLADALDAVKAATK